MTTPNKVASAVERVEKIIYFNSPGTREEAAFVAKLIVREFDLDRAPAAPEDFGISPGIVAKLTDAVLAVVSPEGYDPEEWAQINDAILTALASFLRQPDAPASCDNSSGASVINVPSCVPMPKPSDGAAVPEWAVKAAEEITDTKGFEFRRELVARRAAIIARHAPASPVEVEETDESETIAYWINRLDEEAADHNETWKQLDAWNDAFPGHSPASARDELRANANKGFAWVPCSERMPTEEDSTVCGQLGNVMVMRAGNWISFLSWNQVGQSDAIAWAVIPPYTPAPASARSQDQEDEEALGAALCDYDGDDNDTFTAGFRAALRHARREAQGRDKS